MPSFRYIDRRSSNESLENEVVVFGAEEQNDEEGERGEGTQEKGESAVVGGRYDREEIRGQI